MPGAKHSSLKALSPSNYGSVRRKRRQRQLDPSDPSLNVEMGKESSAPLSRTRCLIEKISVHPASLPWGPEVLFAQPLVSFRMDKGAHLYPQAEAILPVLRALYKEQGAPSGSAGRGDGALPGCFSAIRDCLHAGQSGPCALIVFF